RREAPRPHAAARRWAPVRCTRAGTRWTAFAPGRRGPPRVSWRSARRRRQRPRSSRRAAARARASCRERGAELELVQRTWPFLLDLAELVELREVVGVRALPGAVVDRSPQETVLRRARVRKQRHRIVAPYAVRLQMGAPARHLVVVVEVGRDQVPLDECDMSLRKDETLGERVRGQTALLVQPVAPLGRET